MATQLGFSIDDGTEAKRTTFRGADDKAFDRERRRKRIRTVERAMPSGPCCGRCANWREPDFGEAFGSCLVLAVIGPGSKHHSDVAATEEASAQDRPWDFMRTQPWYDGCQCYAEATP